MTDYPTKYAIGTVVVANHRDALFQEAVVTSAPNGVSDRVSLLITRANDRHAPSNRHHARIQRDQLTLHTFYTIKENNDMTFTNDDLYSHKIQVGDVFHAATGGTSFGKIEVLGKGTRLGTWRCLGTKRSGSTTPIASVNSATLLGGRYTLKPVSDFNQNTEAYARPTNAGGTRPLYDMPEGPTSLIRDGVTVQRYIREDTSTLLHFNAGGAQQAKSVKAKISLLLNATDGYMVLAVPGKYSQDVFYVDSRTAALSALGLKQRKPQPEPTIVTAADGTEWVAA